MKPIKTNDGQARVINDSENVEEKVKTSVRLRKQIKLLKNNKITKIFRAWK
jgi:hypothetical protein